MCDDYGPAVLKASVVTARTGKLMKCRTKAIRTPVVQPVNKFQFFLGSTTLCGMS